MPKNSIPKQKIYKTVPEKIKPLDAEEQAIMQSVERGEWQPVKNRTKEIAAARRYARATFRKDQRMNIRIAQRDMIALKARALREGPVSS